MPEYYILERRKAEFQKMDDFIQEYGDSYYSDKPKIVPNARQSLRSIEDRIDRLLCDVRKNRKKLLYEDVVHIMAWKIGVIDFKKINSDNCLYYRKDWEHLNDKALPQGTEREKLTVSHPNKYNKDAVVEIGKIANYISKEFDSLHIHACKEPQVFLNDPRVHDVSGVGSVYAITLLYFLSGGEYPIYDQFAMMALRAIDSGKKPGEKVHVPDFPDKNSKAFYDLLSPDLSEESIYQEYIRLLNKYFGDRYKTDRNIDRALWVYGHLFINEKE